MYDVTYWRKFTSSDPNPHFENIKQDGRCKHCGEYIYQGVVGTYWHYWAWDGVEPSGHFICTSQTGIDHPYHPRKEDKKWSWLTSLQSLWAWMKHGNC